MPTDSAFVATETPSTLLHPNGSEGRPNTCEEKEKRSLTSIPERCVHIAEAKAKFRYLSIRLARVISAKNKARRLGSADHARCVTEKVIFRVAQVPVLRKEQMRRPPKLTGRFEQANVLLNELRAIHLWDDNYWRCRRPELYEKFAFLTRQKRRCEIIRQLASFRKAE